MPFAVSSSAGVAEFFPDRASGATGSLENHSFDPRSLHSAYGMGKSPLSVPTLPLDLFGDFCRGKRVLVKLDVEGAEASVFAGAMDLIRKVFPVIIVECFEPSRLDVMESLGYSIRPLQENGNYLLVPPGFLLLG